jgi:hypothetical protein
MIEVSPHSRNVETKWVGFMRDHVTMDLRSGILRVFNQGAQPMMKQAVGSGYDHVGPLRYTLSLEVL